MTESLVALAVSFICIFREISQQSKNSLDWPIKGPMPVSKFHDSLAHTLGSRQSNDGTNRQASTDERARFRHDQMGPQILAGLGQLRESHRYLVDA